ncbi:fumarylacetoacetate hydrolase family protein [Bradyrhizobium viridifuturi]|jgi:2-keto-4-pentenoate hydratase/2-oxohepta-3-ene-1,7-dioic acid hydratase in catechol pathway|nr:MULTISPECIES: fumarylacetoacetate hydrolase family protein [Bradyrhizobium]ERF81979.1 MAG: glycerol-3-phosphate dehydrogenase (NAD(P)+) [Bradyrhizobium sp. DFCI-1]MCA3796371.1 fumarylacetoacetate hydrolase family protein [Burkholderia sp.]PSO25876.1 FAA hydrolase family protein [Bradyrhizobium sp. MOS004]QRI67960.1 fumarylacetoacetate hydrolase family protein [Bradyrhizobium sp. PSBB068]MBR1018291.1 fumarylacetoacetate hydrolase family protein [Bradyrhizobium viridifuturi]
MKLLSFVADGRASFGAVKDNGVVDLGARMPECASLRQLLETNRVAEATALVAANAADRAIDKIAFAPVIPDPGKIICVGLNYRDHVAETGRTVTEKPALFARFACSQVGHMQPIVRPKVSDNFDYEGELALVIGKEGRHIPAGQALDHVAGYACYNEGSVRDWQRHTSQFLSGKTFANSGSFGPWLVTRDEIPDPSKLTLQTRLNGTVVQHTTTDLLITGIPELITYISTICPLVPGDVIVTGTPGGVGLKRTPPLWMKPGDTVEVEISGIGVLQNSVIAE